MTMYDTIQNFSLQATLAITLARKRTYQITKCVPTATCTIIVFGCRTIMPHKQHVTKTLL